MEKSGGKKLIVICGPTGIGKTGLSLALAKEFDGCIVSADSMQIYRYMDIGTAKPSVAERRQIPHYMMDIVDPDELYDAARFCREGRQAIAHIHDMNKLPIVVGGTGFYIKALLHGLFEARPVDSLIVERLKKQSAEEGTGILYKRLCECDPEAAARIHPNDVYRVVRALAVYEMTGKPMSALQEDHGFKQNPFDVMKICLNDDREILYDRIDRRVDRMVADGLADEVKTLLGMGYSENLRPMLAIGYRHMTDFLQGRAGWAETIEFLKRDTRRFAKRQLTWFKKETDIIWASPEQIPALTTMIRRFLLDSP